jgi:hypothetical protein
MRLYHGTDIDAAVRFLAGELLDECPALEFKIDGPLGFFLATEIGDAEFFALRQMRGGAVILAFEWTDNARNLLENAGAMHRPIPRGPNSPWFAGEEWFIPPTLFELHNKLLQSGKIRVSPT